MFCSITSDVDECTNNAGMKTNVCVNGQCQNTMKDYICVCNAGFRSDVTKKLCNGEKAYRVTFARRVGWVEDMPLYLRWVYTTPDGVLVKYGTYARYVRSFSLGFSLKDYNRGRNA